MASGAIDEAIARNGKIADMAIDDMSAATTLIVFLSGIGPVAGASAKSGYGRRIAVACVASATGNDFRNAIYMQRLADKDIGVAIACGVNVCMTTARCPDRSGGREPGGNNDNRVSGSCGWRETVAGTASGR